MARATAAVGPRGVGSGAVTACEHTCHGPGSGQGEDVIAGLTEHRTTAATAGNEAGILPLPAAATVGNAAGMSRDLGGSAHTQ